MTMTMTITITITITISRLGRAAVRRLRVADDDALPRGDRGCGAVMGGWLAGWLAGWLGR